MLPFLKNHPFAVEAFFESSIVVSFAVPKEELLPLLPECLEPDTFQEKWGFVALAMVKTKGLRPKGFPAIMGDDFFLTGYRIFSRYTTNAGKRLRGLYIIRSETDKRKMQFFGNIFTHYHYTTTDISTEHKNNTVLIVSQKSGLHVEVDMAKEIVPLPAGSPFSDWKEARRFAGPLPFTFTYNPNNRKVLIIEGVRENWTPAPVELKSWRSDFIQSLSLKGVVPANAFIIRNIPYHWKKGKTELWKG
ncbi:DUF2071 domain-containing protein [Terrimonas sp. NA20]|uniref:DUF2071 domain-containing protein n=1 Tax=Terrimonas ginsenosidimutans TaxID=2908004 RepID=A0ABS9KKK2_9BACT|nr:DUF2071 domain-containing protein [Terrimonas ginsenosidimutans]MCG2612847.1 DUF2071 domain-containing protein [Terrimonas ginsenosidimutans]